MSRLAKLIRKKKRLVVGIMSGTSVDSLDAVLVEISGTGTSTRFRQRAFVSHAYPKGYREFVLKNSLPGSGTVDVLTSLNFLIAHYIADAVKAVARKGRVALADIDLIGSHGQTVQHIPVPREMYGRRIASTLQLGDPSVIAKLTGIVTVGNFRPADMALGGEGAPLIPYYDYVAFRSPVKNRLLLNIGGIANITSLPAGCAVKDVLAFDTGPGNMVIDALAMELFGLPCDRGGRIASRGKIHTDLISDLLRHPYLRRTPPKSTGRELFGRHFVDAVLAKARGVRKEDLIATLSEFTPLTVYQQYTRFLRRRLPKIDELVVSGGGTKNAYLMEALRRYFQPAKILTSDSLGVSSDAKEALCFAILANETISGTASNIPSVTGASAPTILGTISQ